MQSLVKILTSEDRKATLRDTESSAKSAQAFDMKMSGFSVKIIAEKFGVTPQTVRTWLNKYTEEYQQQLEAQSSANIISESLQFLEALEEMCLYEAQQLTMEEDVTDSNVVTKKKAGLGSKGLKLRYIQAAQNARKERIELLKSVGVIPKQPEHLYHHMHEYKQQDVAVVEDLSKSQEELTREILVLLQKGRSI